MIRFAIGPPPALRLLDLQLPRLHAVADGSLNYRTSPLANPDRELSRPDLVTRPFAYWTVITRADPNGRAVASLRVHLNDDLVRVVHAGREQEAKLSDLAAVNRVVSHALADTFELGRTELISDVRAPVDCPDAVALQRRAYNSIQKRRRTVNARKSFQY